MKVYKHVFFDSNLAPELHNYLLSNAIPHKSTFSNISFDMDDANPHWKNVRNIISEKKIKCTSETIFSNEEKLKAKWLLVRSKWRNSYPQPESSFAYRSITYTTKDYCPNCGIGLQQIDSFRLKSSPKWGSRHFMMLNWVEDELFVDDFAMKKLKESELSGFGFLLVKDKKGAKSLPNVYQLKIAQEFAGNLLLGNIDIDNVSTCSICGRLKYHSSGIGMHKFSDTGLRNMPDICHTQQFFGWDHGASQYIIIRQNMYRFLTNNHLDRSLVFEPVFVDSGE